MLKIVIMVIWLIVAVIIGYWVLWGWGDAKPATEKLSQQGVPATPSGPSVSAPGATFNGPVNLYSGNPVTPAPRRISPEAKESFLRAVAGKSRDGTIQLLYNPADQEAEQYTEEIFNLLQYAKFKVVTAKVFMHFGRPPRGLVVTLPGNQFSIGVLEALQASFPDVSAKAGPVFPPLKVENPAQIEIGVRPQ